MCTAGSPKKSQKKDPEVRSQSEKLPSYVTRFDIDLYLLDARN